ncbi:MAG: hypothetical protein JWN86_635 [Planctomycetota bacterium]|nr:hypothetical protein [Planctomycetota bacterium]
MHAKDVILNSLGSSDMITKAYVGDLSDADLMARPVPGMNHIAWQLGHLISVEHKVMEELAPGSSPALPEGFDAKHTKETTTSDDPSKFYTKAEYLAVWDAQHAATKAVVAKLTEEQLDAPAPESFRRMVPTNGLTINFLASHTLMHVGQYVAVRRTLGKPVVI